MSEVGEKYVELMDDIHFQVEGRCGSTQAAAVSEV